MPKRQAASGYAMRGLRSSLVALGPFARLHETDHPANNPTDLLTFAQNTWFRDLDGIVVTRSRPGLVLLGDTMGGLGQWIGQLTTVAGTEYTVAVVAGEIYTYNWGTDAWTKVVSTANLTTASVTLSATANVWATPFADTLVFTDGTNTPFTWDGTTGAGGLTPLTNAPVFYGPPWVYYNQLFGVKNSARNTVVWSEVGDPATGYEAGNYNNAWDLRQTSNDAVVALGATNSMLAVIRQNSATAITGEVTDNFQSTGTTEAIDEANGTRSPGGTIAHGGAVYVYLGDGRIVRTSGGAFEDVSTGLKLSLANRNTGELDNVRCVRWDAGQHGDRLLIGYPETSYTNRMTAFACVNPATGRAESVWRGFQATAMGVVKDASGNPRVAILSGANSMEADTGYAYVLGMADDHTGLDAFSDGDTAITAVVKLPHVGTDTELEKVFLRFDCSSTSPTGMTDVTLGTETPYGTTTVGNFDVQSSGGVYWNQFLWNQANWAGAQKARKTSARLNRKGRWCQFGLTHATSGEVFTLQTAATELAVLDPRMGVP